MVLDLVIRPCITNTLLVHDLLSDDGPLVAQLAVELEQFLLLVVVPVVFFVVAVGEQLVPLLWGCLPLLALLAVPAFEVVLVGHFLGDYGPFLDLVLLFQFTQYQVLVLGPKSHVGHFCLFILYALI